MPFSNGHALVIGVGSYANVPGMNVPITAADARAVATVLDNPQLCGYPPEQVALLTDRAATSAGVAAALDTLASRASADATVLVFYAGHGAYGDDGYYLTTYDTQHQNGKVSIGLRETELIAKLRAIKAKRLLLIVNACHSGEISPVLSGNGESTTGTPVPPQVSAALLGTGAGRVIISACRENQYSFVGPGPLTLFAQALVDGLQGKGVSSQRGYISVFDLYTHLYFALDESVPQHISAAVRAQYGQRQEPELTILKGVGPFPVSLHRGAATLGAFDSAARPTEGTAVREVNPAYSQAMLRQHQQHIGDNAQVGVAVAGDVHGGITTGATIGGHQIHGDYVGGDKVAGDKVVGDKIDARGSQGFVNKPTGTVNQTYGGTQRNINTGGGDYSERNIDKRQGTFVSGDQFNMSGNFSGAILNIKSTLSNVTQSIGAAPHGDSTIKDQLTRLLEQLSVELQKAPPEQAEEAQQAAKRAESAVAEALKPTPDTDDVEYNIARLTKAAHNLAAALPTVPPIATQIADTLRTFVGG